MTKLDTAQRAKLSDSDFAYIDPDGGRHLPIHDAGHVRDAMARFDQTTFASDSAKSAAHAKILAAAKRLGIEVKHFDEPTSDDVHAQQPVTNYAKRSPAMRKLMSGLRAILSLHPVITAEDLETTYRSAIGHAGGKGRKRADEPADWQVCPACQGMDPDDMPSPDCTCPACQAGDPEDCLCAAVAEAANDHDADDMNDPNEMAETSPHIHSESGEAFRFFLPVQFTDAPQWINYLPKPGTYTHPTYGKIEITPARNSAFVQNFTAGVYQAQLPIDAEHQTKLSGAMGYVKTMRQNIDGSVDAEVDWTPRGKTLLATKQFRYFSPEWYDQWAAPDTGATHRDIAIGGALTSRPFFKESSLRPLVASESGFTTPDDSTPFTAPSGRQEIPMPDQTPTQLTEAEILRFREIEAENTALKAAHEATATEARQAAERIAVLETENRRREFTETAKTWAGDTAGHVSFMEALPSDELRAQYVSTQNAQSVALAEALKQARAFEAVGAISFDTGSALDRLQTAAKAIQATEPKLTEAAAWTLALKQNPGLYQEYQANN